MRKRKQTTPLLSSLTTSMLCASLVAAAGAHGFYQKYNTDSWSQPAIAVLMQGLANRDYPWNGSGASADSGNAAIPSVSQSNTEGFPVAYIDQTVSTGSRTADPSVSFDGQPMDTSNSLNRQADSAFPDNASGKYSAA